MKKIIEKFANILEEFEKREISLLVWAATFLGIIIIRLFLDNFIAEASGLVLNIATFIHNIQFFLIIFLLIWLYLSFLLQKNPFRLSRIMIWASFLIIFPPILDIIKTGKGVFWSGYLINDLKNLKIEFLTIFSHLPSGMFYFGTKIVFIFGLVLGAGLVYVKSRKWIKTLVSAIGVYLILFFMAAFPSFLAFFYYFFAGSKKIQNINIPDIFQFVGTPKAIFGLNGYKLFESLIANLNMVYFLLILGILFGFFYFSSKEKFWAVLKNFRYPQIIYHSGLFFVGMGIGFLAYPQNLNINFFSITAVLVLLASIWLAWKASVIANDICDFNIDQITNSNRPLQEGIFRVAEYRDLGLILFFLSLMGGMIIGISFFYLLLVYQVLAWLYSAEPFRFKKFPFLATFLSALASLVVVFLGFSLFSGDQNIQFFPWQVMILLIITLTLSLPIKDFKDIEGDKKDGVRTIPVIFGEEKGRLIVASGIFISFMSSVFLLNERRLFVWAIIFGAITFLIIINQKIKPRQLFWWVLIPVFIYGLMLTLISVF